MSRLGVMAILLLGAASAGCASMQRSNGSLESEAREFMAGYARDLQAGDRGAIADRYDRRGAFMAGTGRKRFMTPDSIRTTYQSATWTAPARFQWHDLSYDVVGPEAVLVTGRFEWTTAGGEVMPASYTAVLVRQDGRLRIRAEHEDVAPSAMRSRICGR